MPKTSFFVSDLHLFARRSQAERHADAIDDAAANAHTFVLGGDIFDFSWSTLPTLEHTVAAAIEWLEALVDQNTHCDFHFVLGNHDSHLLFVNRLEELANLKPNLAWDPYFIRLGRSLFLHGDVADKRKMDQQALDQFRSRWEDDARRAEFRHALYDAAVNLRLHRVAAGCVHRPRRVVKRILLYLDNIGHGPETGLHHVYFGHTHNALTGYEYAGVKFHNGGAPIKGLPFRIVETAVERHDRAVHPA